MRRQLQTLAAITAFAIPLAVAGTVSAWYIDSGCGNGQWHLTVPDQPWADGTIAKFDFDLEHTGEEQYATRGHTVTAPADATFAFVTYSNTPEQTALYRPEGCVAPPTTTTTVPATTTTVPATTTTVTLTTSSVAVVTLETPAPAALLAVDIPPVPQPQGVLSAAGGGQMLPSTGGGSNLLLAGGIAVAAGAVAMLVARRRVA